MAKICNVWRFLLYGFMLVLFVGYDSYAATCSDENGEILFPSGAVTVPSAQELYNNGVIKAVNTSSNNEIYDLDAYVAGEEWSVYFPESNKTISGVAVCGPSGKAKYIAGQSSNAYISTEYPGTPTNPPVAYLGCFCKLGGINDDANYASAGQMGGSGSTAEAKLNNCRANCPSVCANYMATNAAFRAAIYGGADNCPVGTPGDGGGSEPETCDKTATDFCDVNASCEYVLNSEFSVGYTMDVSDDYCYATPNQYTISLSLDGANISETISVYYDIEISDLPTPTMDGKSFQGWFDGNDNQYSNGMVYNVAGDITLYAKWGRDCEFPIGDAISQTPSAGTSLSLPTVATLASQNPSDFTYSGGVYTIGEGNGMAVYNADQRFSVKYENGLLWGTAFCGPNGSGDKTKLYYTNANKGLTAYQAGKGCWCRYGLDDDRITDFPWERAATMNNADDCRATCPSVCANYTATDSQFRSILLNEGEESGTCPVMDNSVQCEEQDGYDAAYNESTGECEYTAHVYTITLDTGEVVSVDIETPVASVSVPAKSGYRFGGYYTQPSGAGVLIYDENGDFALTTTAEKLDYLLKNQTLYANWIETFCTDDDGMVVWNSVDSVMDTDALLSSGVVSKKESSEENVYEIYDFAAYTADQRWAVYFQEYGTVTGSAFCGPRGSKAPGEAVSDVLTGNAGATVTQAYSGCYCRYGDPEPDQPWVKAADYYSSGDDWATRTDACRMNCSAKCAEMIATDSDFRTTLYGGANNCPVGSDDPILCAPGWYMDSGICTLCPDGYTSDAGATAQNQCYKSCYSACKKPKCSDPNATCEYENVHTPGKHYYGDTQCIGATCDVNVTITCNDGYKLVDGTCQKQCTDDEMLIDGTCVEPEFTITTTEMSAGATFSFKMSASGVFYVDFDDGNGVQKIDRTNNTSNTTYTSAAYSTAGTHTIKMYGDATGYEGTNAAISFQDNTNIKTVDGSLGTIFSGSAKYMFDSTFRNCTSLTSIPENLFAGVSGSAWRMFYYTFENCTSLTSIPENLFAGVSGSAGWMFNGTFGSCTSLTNIPENLFAGVSGSADCMFCSTFSGCTSLTSIPENLFAGVSGSARDMFNQTFGSCTSLISIPENLFAGVSGSANYMFSSTFRDCTSLTSIPSDLFAGVSGSANYMFSNTFDGCTSLTSIPENLFAGVSGSANSMFSGTFGSCTSLTSIPENLFAGVNGSAEWMFYYTFYGCTSLASLPDGLFKNIEGKPATNMFYETFDRCTNLSGYIPADTFAKMDSTDFDSATMESIFAGTALDTSCPTGTHQYITGFESAWSGKVACETISCTDDEMLIDGECVAPEFTITTTEMSAGAKFSFKMSASGVFYVDFDDGRGVQKIDRNHTSKAIFTSTAYSTAGAHTIKMYGDATGYNGNAAAISFSGNTNIKTVDGSLGAIFGGNAPYMFRSTFENCTSLESIPADLFSGVTGSSRFMFYYTFLGCTSLQSIPADLFSGVKGSSESMFSGTFLSCTSLQSIPAGLFSGVTGSASDMFSATFKGCTSLQSIPAGLFSGVTGSSEYMFYATFADCTSLESIPADLFSGVTGSSEGMFYATFSDCKSLTSLPDGLFKNIEGEPATDMFYVTFSNCTNLSGYIPADTFAKMDSTDFDSVTMSSIFAKTALDTSCPAGTTQYITGFESAWDGKVACAPCPDGVCSIVTQCGDGNAFGETTCYFDANTGDYTTCDMCEYTSCVDGYEMVDGACEFAPEFAVVTTPISGGTEFSFTLSAKGTYYIDWGDNTGIQSIHKTNVEPQVIGHTYENSADSYTIQMSGAATSYNTTEEPVIDFKGNEYVYELRGSLGTIFGGNTKFMFEHTFQDCINLEIVPAALFNGVAGPDESMFNSTFQGCEKLAEIPSGLFDILGDEYYDAPQQMFMGTFKDCSALNNVPSDLFAKVTGGAYGLFKDAFKNCSSLDSVHPELFVNITTSNANMFESAFQGCTSLTQIPAQLFQNISGGADYMFYSTFRNCTGLTEIQSGLFNGINTNAQHLFDRTFLGCTSLTEIPNDLFNGITTTDNANFMFIGTFEDCTSLTHLPERLFANIQGVPADSMFDKTFMGCDGLLGYINPDFFALLDMNDVSVSSVMDETFTNTTLVKKCPSGTYRVKANFGYTLSGRAVCSPCDAGNMSFAGANMCYVPRKLHINDNDTIDITVNLLPEKPAATMGMAFDIPNAGVYYGCLTTDENRTINNDTDKKMHIEYENQHYLMYDCTAQ